MIYSIRYKEQESFLRLIYGLDTINLELRQMTSPKLLQS